MAITRELPLRNYPSGVRTFVKQMPKGLAGFSISIGRCTNADPTIWSSPDTRIRLKVECSFDGGLTFPSNGGGVEWEQGGGIISSRKGEVHATSVVSAMFNPEPNAVRITVEVINGPVRTYADVTVPD